jgi:hypothetical protein
MQRLYAATEEQARYVKSLLRAHLNRPVWGRGIGIGCIGRVSLPNGRWVRPDFDHGEGCVRGVQINVQKPEHVDIARGMFGDVVYGVPILYEDVGDIVASAGGRQPPTSPPPFGRPEGHLGGSYDWYWWSFGRHAGVPYEPTDETELEARDVDRSVSEMARRLGIVEGVPESLPVWLAGLGPWRGPDGKLGVKVNMNVEPYNWIMMELEDTYDFPRPARPSVLGAPVWIQNVGGALRGLVA